MITCTCVQIAEKAQVHFPMPFQPYPLFSIMRDGPLSCAARLSFRVCEWSQIIVLLFKVRCTPHTCAFCRNQIMLLFVRSGLETTAQQEARSIGAFPCPIYYPACALCVSPGLDRCTLMYCGTARLVPRLQSAHGILSHLALCISN
jgi:hypothetical protein